MHWGNCRITKLRLVLLLTAGFLLVLGPVSAGAADPVNVQITVTMWGPPAKMLPVGDDPNHFIGLGQRKGRAVFSDGRKAAYSNVFILDLVRGKSARAWGYTKFAFKDDSYLFFKWNSQPVGRDEQGRPVMGGTGQLQKGTGPYTGIKGSVKFKTRTLPPSKELPNGGSEAKANLTYTLP